MSAGRDAPPPDGDDRRASALVALLGALLLALAAFPYLRGWAIAPDGFRFTGAVSFHGDFFSYIAKMRQGHDGAWRFVERYTTEPSRPSLLFFFYVALGHVARWTGASLPLAFHVARTVAGGALLWGIDRLARECGMRGSTRVAAFGLAGFGSGFGWFLVLSGINDNPTDFWWAESSVFHSIFLFPHFAASSAALAWCIAEAWAFGAGRSGGAAVARAAAWAFALAWIHPRLLLTVLVVGGLAAVGGALLGQWGWKRWAIALGTIFVAGAAPSLAIVLSYRGDPVWDAWAKTPTETPPVVWFGEALGILWPLAALGAVAAVRERRPWATVVVAWAVAGAALPYLPYLSQRRLVQGVGIPLAILGAHWLGTRALAPRAGSPPRALGRAIAVATVAFASLSSLAIVASGARTLEFGRFPWYASDARFEAMRWLRERTRRDDVVLCSSGSGQLVPAFAGNRVVVGHWAETLDRPRKEADAAEFFRAETPAERRDEIARAYGTRFVLHSGFERMLGEYDPASEPDRWRLRWERDGIAVYERVGDR